MTPDFHCPHALLYCVEAEACCAEGVLCREVQAGLCEAGFRPEAVVTKERPAKSWAASELA